MTDSLQVVFFGTSPFGIPALRRLREAGHRLVGVVTQPDRPRGRGRRATPSAVKAEVATLGCPVLQPERVGEIVGDLRALAPDAAVVAAYGQFLPERIIDAPRLASVNIHGSVLPAYRGAAPIQRAVMNGDSESGVTIFRIVRQMDAGPILATRATPIRPGETAGDLEGRLSELGAEVLVEVLADLPAALEGERVQDESKVTYAPRLSKEEGRLDFGAPPERIVQRVLGLQPWPGAFADLRRGDEKVGTIRLLGVEPVEPGAMDDGPSPPAAGTVVRVEPDGIVVAVAGGGVRIRRLQRPGGKPLEAAAYLRGHTILPGDRLG